MNRRLVTNLGRTPTETFSNCVPLSNGHLAPASIDSIPGDRPGTDNQTTIKR